MRYFLVKSDHFVAMKFSWKVSRKFHEKFPEKLHFSRNFLEKLHESKYTISYMNIWWKVSRNFHEKRGFSREFSWKFLENVFMIVSRNISRKNNLLCRYLKPTKNWITFKFGAHDFSTGSYYPKIVINNRRLGNKHTRFCSSSRLASQLYLLTCKGIMKIGHCVNNDKHSCCNSKLRKSSNDTPLLLPISE